MSYILSLQGEDDGLFMAAILYKTRKLFMCRALMCFKQRNLLSLYLLQVLAKVVGAILLNADFEKIITEVFLADDMSDFLDKCGIPALGFDCGIGFLKIRRTGC
jgi:hypothetical protein